MPLLSFHDQQRPLFVVPVRSGRTIIGRSDHQCDIALRADGISRVHCVVELGPTGARLIDRSRHGTVLNGQAVTEAALADGDVITIGDVQVRYATEGDARASEVTSSTLIHRHLHDELVAASEAGVAYEGVRLRFVRGPRQGEVQAIEVSPTTLGGPGSDQVLDDQLPRSAARLRVVRGRPLVQPGTAAVYLSGVRVREATPVLPAEEVRVGEHGFIVEADRAEVDREADTFGEMVGRSPVMRKLFGALTRIAAHDQPVLLIGESGTGKELAARGLHDQGTRADGPFVPINCAAVTETLFESELFGHEKGSFTGATSRMDGAFHRADGGTLFLDEVGELKLDLQAKLLRALESGEVRRVGGHEPTFPDVRVVAATNRDLTTMMAEGTFRSDLYWRLAVLTVRVPSLRERPGDVRQIAHALVKRHHPGVALDDDAVARLEAHRWPGNVRELRNVLTRAFVLAGAPIRAEAIELEPWRPPSGHAVAAPATPATEALRIRQALAETGGNRSQAARILGMPRSTLLYKIEKHGLNRDE
ncbi:MAG: sigma 54-interacting transcriptional regulator [Myxococcota bacterium]